MTLAFNGTLDLEILIDTGLPDVDLERLRSIVPFILEREEQQGDWLINVVLVDDAALQDLHSRFMGVDEETDVMTFPLGEATPGGDIVVSVHRATEQAASFNHTLAQEVEFLVAHGLLHLCGWEDGDETQRAAMLARQTGLLRSFDGTGVSGAGKR